MTPENSRLGWSGVGVVKEKRVKLRISRIYCSHIRLRSLSRGGAVGKEYGLKIIYLIYSI